MTGLGGHCLNEPNHLKAHWISGPAHLLRCLRALGGDGFAGALASARGEPCQHVALRVPDSACSGGTEVARAVPSESVLIHCVGVDAEDFGDFLRVKRAPFRSIAEQC